MSETLPPNGTLTFGVVSTSKPSDVHQLTGQSAVAELIEVNADLLRSALTRQLEPLQNVLDQLPAKKRSFSVQELELDLCIKLEGELKVFIGGTKAAGEVSFKVTLRRS